MALFGFSKGQTLHGTYKLVDRIGEGGTGVVFRGERVRGGQTVAIKTMALEGGRSIEAYDLWLEEMARIGSLDHPHIVEILDLNELDFNHPFVVMDLVDGKDLGDVIVEQGNLSPHVVLDLVKQAAGALTRVHAKGLIHGALRPGNVLLESVDTGYVVKLTDFGIHRLQRTVVEGMDRDPIGTPPFMAPEQARGDDDALDAATDVWALGALAYLALCGEPPLAARYLTRFIDRVCAKDPPPLSQRVEGLPEMFDRVLAKALARDREERYAAVGPFVLDLAAAVALVKIDEEEDKKRALFRSDEPEEDYQKVVFQPRPLPPEDPGPALPPPAPEDLRKTAVLEPPAGEQEENEAHQERVTELYQPPVEEAASRQGGKPFWRMEEQELAEVADDEEETQVVIDLGELSTAEIEQEEPTELMDVAELDTEEDPLRKTAVLEEPGAGEEQLGETLKEYAPTKEMKVKLRETLLEQERAESLPGLKDVGQDDDELPTVRTPIAAREHDWSADHSATVKDVGAEGVTPSAIKRMLQEQALKKEGGEGNGED